MLTRVALITLLTTPAALGYELFALGYELFGLKWGDDPFGSPAVVTWGYMPDGTIADPDFRIDINIPSTGVDGGSRLSELRALVDAGAGSGAFDQAIQNAFDTWQAACGITFVFVPDPTGLPINDPGAVTPDIRIGAFVPEVGHPFDNVAAVGFAPPPNGGTLAGDILLNFNAVFFIAPGSEDDPILEFGNDLENLVLHELGHAAIGLAHPEVGPGVVMYVGGGCCDVINRDLHPDDIAGAVAVYGPPDTTPPALNSVRSRKLHG